MAIRHIKGISCNHCGRYQGEVITSGAVYCIYCHKWIDENEKNI